MPFAHSRWHVCWRLLAFGHMFWYPSLAIHVHLASWKGFYTFFCVYLLTFHHPACVFAFYKNLLQAQTGL